jgi:hypothetical protein
VGAEVRVVRVVCGGRLLSVGAAAVRCGRVVAVLRHGGLSGIWVVVSVRVCGPVRLGEELGGGGVVRHCVCSLFCGLAVVRGRFSWVEDSGRASMV